MTNTTETETESLSTAVLAFKVAPEGDQAPWQLLIAAYREGPRELYAPVIIRLLDDQIQAAARRLRAPIPAITAEDIRQELALRVLEAAAEMPLARDPRWIPRRLMLRARTGVARWLSAELRADSLQPPGRDEWSGR